MHTLIENLVLSLWGSFFLFSSYAEIGVTGDNNATVVGNNNVVEMSLI
jgi:hypothetical protein